MLKKSRVASSKVVGKSRATPLIGMGLADMLKNWDATGTLGTPDSADPAVSVPTYSRNREFCPLIRKCGTPDSADTAVTVPTYTRNREFRPLIRKWDRQEHLDKLNPEDNQVKKLIQVLNDLRW